MSKERFTCVVFGSELTFSVSPEEKSTLQKIIVQLEEKFSSVISDEMFLTNDFIKKLIELFAHYTHYKNQSVKGIHLSEKSFDTLTDLIKNISQSLDN